MLNTKLLGELNKAIDITYILWFLHCSFYLSFIEKPIKCVSEGILLQNTPSLFEKKLQKNNKQIYIDLVNLFKKEGIRKL